MTSRRRFLRTTALAAALAPLLPRAADAQEAASKAKPRPKPGAKPEGVVVNDAQSQLNSTRVFKIAEPTNVDGIRAAYAAARADEKPVCVAGSRHSMGTQQFMTDGLLIDTRKMAK